MDMRRLLAVSCVGVVAGTLASNARAQESGESPAERDVPGTSRPHAESPGDAEAVPDTDENPVFAPVLVEFVEASYPPEAAA